MQKRVLQKKLQQPDRWEAKTWSIQKLFSAIEQKLTEEQSENIEGMITEHELLTALKSTQNGKSPGSDGFTAEFYKLFWQDIKVLQLSSINAALFLLRWDVHHEKTWFDYTSAQERERSSSSEKLKTHISSKQVL